MASPLWQPGVSGNPNGRPPGARNKRTEEIWRRLEARGDIDPADFLSSVVANKNESSELRTQAANMLLPYRHAKRGTLVAPRFLEEPVQVPDFQTVEEAEAFLNQLSTRFGSTELDAQSALDLSTLVRNWILAKHADEELKIKRLAQGQDTGETIIRIEGGLPKLPGTTITGWPHQLNGHRADELLIDSAPNDSLPVKDSVALAQDTESAQSLTAF